MIKKNNINYKTDRTESELLQLIKDVKTNKAAQPFCFILGSGASVSSGIPSGNKLAKAWFEELQQIEMQDWLDSEKIDADNCDTFYTKLFEQRFRMTPEQGNQFLQKIMEDKEPSLGYVILAHIMANTIHNLVITTNFDRMVEDALSYYTKKMPLVFGHETAINYAQNKFDRPTVVKLHRDILLSPLNSSKETETLQMGWEDALDRILEHYCVIVLGYGGNDGSLMGYLKESKDKINRQPIFWCIRKGDNPPNQLEDALSTKDYLIGIDGFDEFMFKLARIFEIKLPETESEINDSIIIKDAKERATEIVKKIEQLKKQLSEQKDEQSEALSESVGDWLGNNDWWALQREINKIDNKQIDEKNTAYLNALEKLPDNLNLFNNYAVFLQTIKKNHVQAEEYYKKALKLDPENAVINGNYAVFLTDIKKDHVQAEEYYKKALKLDPEDARINASYANFLQTIKKNHVQAEEYYKKALKLDPENAVINGNYAVFLKEIKKDHTQAEAYYKKALKLDPEDAGINASYANFLKDIKKDHTQAEAYYKKALKLDPEDAGINASYANFLKDIKKDHVQAEEYYKKALELDPENVGIMETTQIFLTI